MKIGDKVRFEDGDKGVIAKISDRYVTVRYFATSLGYIHDYDIYKECAHPPFLIKELKPIIIIK